MVLIPCSDAWVMAVADLDPAVTSRFPASVASPKTVHALLDKWCFAETVTRLGLSHPRTTIVTSPDDLTQLPDEAFRRTFLKPRDSYAFRNRYGVKGLWVRSRADALELAEGFHRLGLELLLQEYIPGPETRHYFIDGFVDRQGVVCGRMARQRLRMYPPDFGNSCYMTSVSLDEVTPAVAALDRLLQAVHYRGVFNAEFKYDERDRQFKILEVNPRPWAQVAFAACCGLDVCEMAYRDAIGLPVQPVHTYRIGQRWVFPAQDQRACWRLFGQGRLRPWDVLRGWVGAAQPILSLDDPIPSLTFFLERFRPFLGRLFGTRRSATRRSPAWRD